MPEPKKRRNVLLYLAAEGVIPVLGGCAGALAGGPVAGLAGVAVGKAVEKAINLFGQGIVERLAGVVRREPGGRAGGGRGSWPRAPRGGRPGRGGPQRPPPTSPRTRARRTSCSPSSSSPRSRCRPTGRSSPTRSAGAGPSPPPARSTTPARSSNSSPRTYHPYPASADLPGTPYRLVELLGAGGFGAVYRAVSPTLQHLPLAIKFCLDRSLLPALNQERSNLERLMRAGGDHRAAHVVRLYGYDLDHPTPYLVYEYVAGGDLTRLVAARPGDRRRSARPAEVLGWVLQVAEGLAFAHRSGARPPRPQAGERAGGRVRGQAGPAWESC